MTLLQIVNKVLKRLREETVANTQNNAYSALIAEFVAETHLDLALEHDWSIGYTEVEFDTVASQAVYDLSAQATNEYCQLQFRTPPTLWEDSSADKPIAYLDYLSADQFIFQKNLDRDANKRPCYVTVRQRAAGGWEAELYPTPNQVDTVRIPFWIAETPLESDGTDDATEIRIPWRPIYLGALFLALNERGEEIGEPGNIAERRWLKSVGEAVEADVKLREMTDRYDWYRG